MHVHVVSFLRRAGADDGHGGADGGGVQALRPADQRPRRRSGGAVPGRSLFGAGPVRGGGHTGVPGGVFVGAEPQRHRDLRRGAAAGHQRHLPLGHGGVAEGGGLSGEQGPQLRLFAGHELGHIHGGDGAGLSAGADDGDQPLPPCGPGAARTRCPT